MIYNFIPCRQVVAKVLADLDIKEESIRISDMIEWCAEAIEKIGSVKQLIRKTSGVDGTETLTLSGYQASLPSDLFRLNQAMYSVGIGGPWLPMTIATGSFNLYADATDSMNSNGISTEFTVPESTLVDLVKILYGISNYQEALSKLQEENVRVTLTAMIKIANIDPTKVAVGIKYTIKPGHINVNVRDGYIRISYDAISVDEDGYPMIPDLASYTEALYWYVTMKLKYPEYLSGRMNREIYYDIRRSWNFYCKQAYGESMMPGQDEMETIKNVWNKLKVDYNAQYTGYEDLGEPQRTRSTNSR